MKKEMLEMLIRDDGATSVEYAIMGSLIAAVIAGVVSILGGQVFNLFDAIKWW